MKTGELEDWVSWNLTCANPPTHQGEKEKAEAGLFLPEYQPLCLFSLTANTPWFSYCGGAERERGGQTCRATFGIHFVSMTCWLVYVLWCCWVWQDLLLVLIWKLEHLPKRSTSLKEIKKLLLRYIALGAVKWIKKKTCPEGFVAITVTSFASASSFRNERARWISALGQNVNNNKCQDRTSEFPTLTSTFSLLLHHVVTRCTWSFSCLKVPHCSHFFIPDSVAAALHS